jgi:ferritin-like metal-binding protein YciE
MKENRLKHLFVEELKDIYSAENQMVKALPKLAKAATSPGAEGWVRGAFDADQGTCGKTGTDF